MKHPDIIFVYRSTDIVVKMDDRYHLLGIESVSGLPAVIEPGSDQVYTRSCSYNVYQLQVHNILQSESIIVATSYYL